MTRGVVIGKFYPPHRGHKHLIETALAHVDDLAVIVCEHPGQTIAGATRQSWIQRIHPKARVIVVPDVLAADDSDGWAKYTIETLGYAPDVVFTSEAYGDAYARFMGAKHVLVDGNRTHVPVSGTMIRSDPLGHWEDLEPPVRGYYALRVVAIGAESTGTTTIAQDLAAHYRTAWVPEFGRLYSEGKFPGESQWHSDEFLYIAEQQNLLEDWLAESCNRILICDTDAFATGVWHERYMGWRSTDVESRGAHRRYDLYLLTDVSVPFVQDGVRDGEHIREWMHQTFIDRLNEAGKRFLLLSGDRATRLADAVSACDRLLAGAHTRA